MRSVASGIYLLALCDANIILIITVTFLLSTQYQNIIHILYNAPYLLYVPSGSARRGLEFEGGIKWDMGNIELLDQITMLNAYSKRKSYSKDIVGDLENSSCGIVNLKKVRNSRFFIFYFLFLFFWMRFYFAVWLHNSVKNRIFFVIIIFLFIFSI